MMVFPGFMCTVRARSASPVPGRWSHRLGGGQEVGVQTGPQGDVEARLGLRTTIFDHSPTLLLLLKKKL